MVKTSAGFLMYRIKNYKLEVFLVHPGGPFWEHKDLGIWGIPKGERDDPSHDLFDVAKREFSEETGIAIPENTKFIPLGNIKQGNGKIVHAWGFLNNENFKFNCTSYINMMYNDKMIEFCEVDKGEFFSVEIAKKKILNSQFELVERLMKKLNIKDKSDKQLKL